MWLLRLGGSLCRLANRALLFVAPFVTALLLAALTLLLTVWIVDQVGLLLLDELPQRQVGVSIGVIPAVYIGLTSFVAMTILCDGMNPWPDVVRMHYDLLIKPFTGETESEQRR